LKMPDQPTCLDVVHRLPWFLNSTLEADERRRVREHLLGCSACRAELARSRDFYLLVRVQATTVAPPEEPSVLPFVRAVSSRARRTRALPWWAVAAAALGLIWLSVLKQKGGFEGPTAIELSGAPRPAALNAPLVPPTSTESPRDLVFADNFDDGRMDRWNAASSPAERL
jgi:anti-sigma factor RsiW